MSTTPLTDPRLSIKVKRELFRFHSLLEWVNKAQRWYANCGVRPGHYITVDANGHVMHMGKCFNEAEKQEAFPVIVYELQTNWPSAPAPADPHTFLTNAEDGPAETRMNTGS